MFKYILKIHFSTIYFYNCLAINAVNGEDKWNKNQRTQMNLTWFNQYDLHSRAKR